MVATRDLLPTMNRQMTILKLKRQPLFQQVCFICLCLRFQVMQMKYFGYFIKISFYPKTRCSWNSLIWSWIQWGSEIRTSLDFKWLKRGWAANCPDFEWDLNPETQPFEIRTNGSFSQKPFEIRTKKVRIFELSDFQMVGTIAKAKAGPFENQIQMVRFHMFPVFKWSDFRSPLYIHWLWSPVDASRSHTLFA